MLPGSESAGLVSPSIFRAVLTTSKPSHTWQDKTKQRTEKHYRKQHEPSQPEKYWQISRILPLRRRGRSSCSGWVRWRKACSSGPSSVLWGGPPRPENTRETFLVKMSETRLYDEWIQLFVHVPIEGLHTCMSLRPTSLKPFFSKRRTIAPSCFRWTPSGFTATKVRSFTPVQPANSDDRNRNLKKKDPHSDQTTENCPHTHTQTKKAFMHCGRDGRRVASHIYCTYIIKC